MLVLGRGPAALAAAAALCERRLRTGVVGPAGPIRWPATYGAWLDELEEAGLADAAGTTWPAAVVDAGGGRRHRLERPYALIDNAALADTLAGRCAGGDARWIDGTVEDARREGVRTVVRLADGREVSSRVAVDAMGGASPLVRRPSSPAPAWQTALGAVVDAGRDAVPGYAADEAVLMDWRPASDGDRVEGAEGAQGDADDGLPPTFLYAFPLGGGRIFVEETVLAARPEVDPDALAGRLRARIAALGLEDAPVVGGERVRIAMGGALPEPRPGVVAFGAAGGGVHPATGYSLARSLRDAPRLADAVVEALESGDDDPAEAVRSVLHDADRARRRGLLLFGLEALLRLDAARTRDFFDAFFRVLPEREWRGYLGDRLPAAALARTMARLFARSPAPVRLTLARTLLGAPGFALGRRMLAGLGGDDR